LPDVPHLQGADRAALAATAVAELDSEVLVLDDGFQHRRLARDLDLYWSMPPTRGARATFSRAACCASGPVSLRGRNGHADALRSGGCNRAWPFARNGHSPGSGRAGRRDDAPGCGLGQRRPGHGTVGGTAGAARRRLLRHWQPGCVRRTLADLGTAPSDFRTFPDHHAYTRTDVEDLRNWARQQATDCMVVTTQKDLVKLRLARLDGRPLWALRIRLHVESGQEALGS